VGWLEFAVIVGCGLVGFMIVNAVIDNRRARSGQQSDPGKSRSEHPEGATRESNQQDQKVEEGNPRPWWDVLNVDKNAAPDQIKEAFRREISKYHPDRVEGLGIELRELADRKSKEVNLAYAIAKRQRRFN
jgi:DnaJ-class molecular chaperone